MPRHQLSASIDADLYDELDRIAEEEGESRSEIANRLLRKGVEQRRTLETVRTAGYAGVATASLVLLLVTVANLHLFPVG